MSPPAAQPIFVHADEAARERFRAAFGGHVATPEEAGPLVEAVTECAALIVDVREAALLSRMQRLRRDTPRVLMLDVEDAALVRHAFQELHATACVPREWQLQEMEDALARANARQRRRAMEREVVLGAFLMGRPPLAAVVVRDVAHEVKNSLGVVQANASFLKQSGRALVEQVQREGLGVELVERLEELASAAVDAMDAVQAVAGTISQARAREQHRAIRRQEPVELGFLLTAVARLLTRENLRGGMLDIVVDEDARTPRTDPAMLAMIMMHLLLNACAALPVERVGNSVVIRARRVADALELSVEDNGCGIAPAHQPLIFQPHFTTHPGSLGLGLAVSREMARQLGGTLGFRSQEGEGTLFELRIPSAY